MQHSVWCSLLHIFVCISIEWFWLCVLCLSSVLSFRKEIFFSYSFICLHHRGKSCMCSRKGIENIISGPSFDCEMHTSFDKHTLLNKDSYLNPSFALS